MWSWIIAGALLIIAGIYFGIGWVQTLGIGLIALPLIIIALILLIIFAVVLLFLLLGIVVLFKTAKKKRG